VIAAQNAAQNLVAKHNQMAIYVSLWRSVTDPNQRPSAPKAFE